VGAAPGHGGPEVLAQLHKRSLSIAGHRTSLSLEPEFWTALTEAAATRRLSIAALVGEIDRARSGGNLSSAVRVFLLAEAGRNARPTAKD
jgi:predicted DNA-binding ribbon-helix-helix protein